MKIACLRYVGPWGQDCVSGVRPCLVHSQNLSELIVHFDGGQNPYRTAVPSHLELSAEHRGSRKGFLHGCGNMVPALASLFASPCVCSRSWLAKYISIVVHLSVKEMPHKMSDATRKGQLIKLDETRQAMPLIVGKINPFPLWCP